MPVMTQGKVLESRDGWVRLETAAGTGWIRQENFIEVPFRNPGK